MAGPRSTSPLEIRVHRRGTVPPDAVVAPVRPAYAALQIAPQHLYKAVGLLFLFALLYHYLEALIQVGLLMYAAAITAVAFNAAVQKLPGRRKWTTGVLGFLILAAMAAALWFGIPLLSSEIRDLASRAPEFTAFCSNWCKKASDPYGFWALICRLPTIGRKRSSF